MPFPVAAAIAAGAAIAGQAVQSTGAKIQNNKNWRRTKQMMGMQAEENRAMALFNNEQQMKMWEATGPKGQMEQLGKAGLNPGLIYGMGGAGGQTAQAAQAAPVSAGNVQGENPMQGAGMTGAVVGQQLALMDAQRRNIDADTAAKKAAAGLDTASAANKPLEGLNLSKDLQVKDQGIKSAEAQQLLTETNQKVAEIERNIKDNTFNDVIDMVIKDRRMKDQQLESMVRNNNISEATKQTTIDRIRAEYAGVLITNALSHQKTIESASNVAVNQQQISNMANDIVQKWRHLEIEGKQYGENERAGANRRFVEDVSNSTKLTYEAVGDILKAIGLSNFMKSDRTVIQGFKKPY
ncbi:MAG: DNA pilot protein [Microviridae sp.]|nr:MAG: DNA pilot protein [Microviridae sp.]